MRLSIPSFFISIAFLSQFSLARGLVEGSGHRVFEHSVREVPRSKERGIEPEYRQVDLPELKGLPFGQIYSTGALKFFPCNGGLLAPNLVVTAAHCIRDLVGPEAIGKVFFVPADEEDSSLKIAKTDQFEVVEVLYPTSPRPIPSYHVGSQLKPISELQPIQENDIAVLVLNKSLAQRLKNHRLLVVDDKSRSEIIAGGKALSIYSHAQYRVEDYYSRGLLQPLLVQEQACVAGEEASFVGDSPVLLMNCETKKGDSGAPLVSVENGGFVVSGVLISGINPSQGLGGSRMLLLEPHLEWLNRILDEYKFPGE